eukprot:13285282-Ditylum_brightwellii.AAC.1
MLIHFPRTKPLDISITTSQGIKSLDITITGGTRATCNPNKQAKATIKMYTWEEALKHCGTIWPNI